jgi:hypothetical protein
VPPGLLGDNERFDAVKLFHRFRPVKQERHQGIGIRHLVSGNRHLASGDAVSEPGYERQPDAYSYYQIPDARYLLPFDADLALAVDRA